MHLLDPIPGAAHWRGGERRKAIVLAALFAALAALFWRRQDLILEALRAADPLSGMSPERQRDILASSAALVLLLGGVVAYSWRGPIRPRGRRSSGRPESLWAAVRRRFWRSPSGKAGIAIVATLFLVAILCPLMTRFDPLRPGDIVEDALLPPSLEHPLGTDAVARDVLSRVLYGSRVSLLVGFLAVSIAVAIGTLYGALSGYHGGRIDAFLMRWIDLLLAFPAIILLITIVGLWGRQPAWSIAMLIGLLSWMRVARLVRGQFLSVKEREFVLAARALGAGPWRLIGHHLLPNSLTPIIIFATLGVGNAILVEAGLSYIGLGIEPPAPSWGNIVSANRGAVLREWWIPFSAGFAVVVTVIGFNLVGDALRDALDPRMEKR